MPWIYLLLSFAAFAMAFKTTSVGLAAFCMLAALILMLLWVMGLLARRVGNSTRDDSLMLDPMELRRLREAAEARRGTTSPSPPPVEPPAA